MKILAIDLETYSSIDIRKAGLYKYVENSEILLFAYTYDDEPVRVVDMACGETVPENVLADLDNPDVLKPLLTQLLKCMCWGTGWEDDWTRHNGFARWYRVIPWDCREA